MKKVSTLFPPVVAIPLFLVDKRPVDDIPPFEIKMTFSYFIVILFDMELFQQYFCFAFVLSLILSASFCREFCRSNNDCKSEKEKQICGQQGKNKNNVTKNVSS